MKHTRSSATAPRVLALSAAACFLAASFATGALPAGETRKKVPAPAKKARTARRASLPSGWSFEIRTLKVSRGDFLPSDDGDSRASSFSMMGVGTEVTVFFRAKGMTIVDIDTSASTIDSFKDERGKDLLEKTDAKGGGFFGGPVSGSEVSRSGDLAKVEFRAPGIPSPGAGKVEIKGLLAVLTGAEPKTAEAKGIALEEGAKVPLGGIEFKVKEWRKGSLGFGGAGEGAKDPHTLTLETSADIRKIKTIEFLDPKGETIKAREMGRGTMNMLGARSSEISWTFPAPVVSVTVRAALWSRTEEVVVPVSIAATLGL